MSPARTGDGHRPTCVHTDGAGRCGRPAALIVTITGPDDPPRQATACGIPHARLLAESNQDRPARLTIAPIADQLTCVDCAAVVAFGPDATTPVGPDGQPGCGATGNAHRIAHDCESAGTLTYAGDYGAPGVGQAWDCTVCGRGWARLGGRFYPADWGVHILTPQDCE